ncbi:MAG: type II toxin-antitoxin system HicA family toxin [Parcubacteria group bacterium]|nr:type II toxin-antitoxin system HicA family toxin [Parcubacteria group bacterium]
MKRKNFLRHLAREGCVFVREGAKHSVFFNPLTKKFSTVPRHNEIDNFLIRKICRDLGIREI